MHTRKVDIANFGEIKNAHMEPHYKKWCASGRLRRSEIGSSSVSNRKALPPFVPRPSIVRWRFPRSFCALIFTTNKTGDLIVEAEDVQANEDWPGENAKLGQDFRTDFDENVVALVNRNFKKDCQL